MKKKSRRGSLANKHIKNRVLEIELSKYVQEVKEPAHAQNDSFEAKMQRRIEDGPEPRKRQKRMEEEKKEEVENKKEDKAEDKAENKSKIEGKNEEVIDCNEKKDCKIEQKAASTAETLKKMKCGCVSHGAKSQRSFISNKTQ